MKFFMFVGKCMKDATHDNSTVDTQWRLPNITMGISFYFAIKTKNLQIFIS
jgi:hypothetical protein